MVGPCIAGHMCARAVVARSEQPAVATTGRMQQCERMGEIDLLPNTSGASGAQQLVTLVVPGAQVCLHSGQCKIVDGIDDLHIVVP